MPEDVDMLTYLLPNELRFDLKVDRCFHWTGEWPEDSLQMTEGVGNVLLGTASDTRRHQRRPAPGGLAVCLSDCVISTLTPSQPSSLFMRFVGLNTERGCGTVKQLFPWKETAITISQQTTTGKLLEWQREHLNNLFKGLASLLQLPELF